MNSLLKKPTLNPSEVNNYRSVSLLPFLSKTLKRAIFNQLSSYLHLNNLLDPHQSGFKAGHSTETALLAVSEQIHTARTASLSSVLILLDLSAAFDTVNHQILISSLQDLGVHHLKINLDKAKLLFLPGKSSPTNDLSPIANIAATTQSCRYMLHNNNVPFSHRRLQRFWSRLWSSHAQTIAAPSCWSAC